MKITSENSPKPDLGLFKPQLGELASCLSELPPYLHSSPSLHVTTIAIQEQIKRTQETKIGMGLRGGALALLLLLFVHGGQRAAEAGGDAFVRVQGTRFVQDGKPFFANGFNAYWLMTFGADPARRGKVTSALSQAAGAGLSVARTWAFSDGGGSALQYSPGRYNENTFQVIILFISLVPTTRILVLRCSCYLSALFLSC
jgi:hypothetical protein